MPRRRVDTVIVGAGQAGLSTAYWLKRLGLEAVVLDAHSRVGDQWRERYDSLLLNTPAQWNGQPGMPFPAPRNSYPSGHELADYFEAYAREMGLDVRGSAPVTRIDRLSTGDYLVTSSHMVFEANQVVVATGGEHHPKTPEFASSLDPGIRALHAHEYRNPGQLLPGQVLVVGAGQSGADVALEVAQAGHATWLSGRINGEVPVDLGSRKAKVAAPVLWFIANHVLTTRNPIGRRAKPGIRTGGTPLVRVKLKDLVAAGVQHSASRTVGVLDGRPVLEDGQVLDVANVLWCTGYRQDFSLIHPAVTGSDGWPLDEGGVVPSSPGLYFAGLLYQRGFYSMLVGGASRDGRYVARQIAARARRRAAAG